MTQRGKVTLLLLFFAVCGSAALLNYEGLWRVERVKPVDLYSVVYAQLAAFRAEDFPRAYQEASSGIQQQFNIVQFTDMVRNDYGGMVRAQRVEFGFVETQGRRAILQVFFIDQYGQVTPCVYTMISEGDSWKIEGARLMRRWPLGARLGGIWS